MPKLAITVLSAVLLSLCHAGLSHADLFIFIDGIPGESHVVNRQNWIDIASTSWGGERRTSRSSHENSVQAAGNH